jgi:DNA-binding SARP family transcriptional activator/ABC-type branched-subunit amino acid transport system substrate-binding protein
LDYCLLGPLDVRDDGRPVTLGTAKDRALLVLLLLHRGEVVSSTRLIDALWGEHPPPTAAKSLQVHVSHLRKALGARAIVTRGHGYVLEAGAGDVDIDRFARAAEEGRSRLAAGDAAGAADALRSALAMWRGPALAEVAYEPFAEAEAARLEELRLAAVEDRVDADLALGRHAALVAELEALVREHPLRERLRGQLMLALYRCGRQADALERYRQGRDALVDELGLEPGRELRDLEAAILRQVPELDGPRAIPGEPSRPTRRRAVPRWLVVAGATLVVVAGAAALLLGRGGSGGSESRLLGDERIGTVDATTGRVVAEEEVPGAPDRLAAGGGVVWAIGDASRTVTAIDVAQRSPLHVISPGGAPSDVAVDSRSVWVLDEQRRTVRRLSPDYPGTPLFMTRLPAPVPRRTTLPRSMDAFDPWTIAAGAGAAWVTDGSSRLTRIDARTGRRTVADAGMPLNGVAADRTSVWAISGRRATVVRVDPRSGRATVRISVVSRPGVVSPYPVAVDIGAGSLWVLNGNTASVTRIDPKLRGVVGTHDIGIDHAPVSIAAGAGAAWVADGDGTLARIDAVTGRRSFTAVAHGLDDVAVARGSVWVSATSGSAPATISPSAVATPAGLRLLSRSACAPVEYRRGDAPRVLIASDMPLQDGQALFGLQLTEAIRYVLRSHGFRAGRIPVAYQACDDSTALGPDRGKCTANARMYARRPDLVAIIGPFASDCARLEVPVLNAAPGGPLAAISPTNTYVGLTRAGPGTAPDEPARYAPSGRRSYVRLVAADDVQAAADAQALHTLGARRVYVVQDSTDYGIGIAAGFPRPARRLGLRVVGRGVLEGSGVVRAARAARADAVFLAGFFDTDWARLVRELRKRLPGARLIAPDGFAVPLLGKITGPDAEGLLVSFVGVPAERLTGRGAAFVRRFRAAIGAATYPVSYAAYAAQAAEVVLDAIARSDGSRASVIRELFATRVRDGLLGSFRVTPTGDVTADAITIYRVTHGALRPWRVFQPPTTLVSGG